MARVVLSERGQVADVEAEAALLAGPSTEPRAEAVQLPGAVVGEHVVADDLSAADPGEPWIADHVAAVDGAAGMVRIGQRGEDRGAAREAPPERGESLEGRPAEVRASRLGDRQVVDLLVAVVADIADCDRLRPPVEGEAPRVPQAVGPDLVPSGPADERVVGRDRVGRGAVRRRVDSQQLAEQEIEVLRVLGRVPGRPTVPGAQIEIAVWAEDDQASVMRLGRLRNAEDRAAGPRVRHQRVVSAVAELVHLQVVPAVVVGDVEASRPAVVGWEGDRGHSWISSRPVVLDQPVDVEERTRHQVVVRDDPDRAAFLHDVELRVLPGRLGEVDGLAQLCDSLQGDELGSQGAAPLDGDAHRCRRDRDEGSDGGLDPATAQGGPHVKGMREAWPRLLAAHTAVFVSACGRIGRPGH